MHRARFASPTPFCPRWSALSLVSDAPVDLRHYYARSPRNPARGEVGVYHRQVVFRHYDFSSAFFPQVVEEHGRAELHHVLRHVEVLCNTIVSSLTKREQCQRLHQEILVDLQRLVGRIGAEPEAIVFSPGQSGVRKDKLWRFLKIFEFRFNLRSLNPFDRLSTLVGLLL